jgi:hypothetical protein
VSQLRRAAKNGSERQGFVVKQQINLAGKTAAAVLWRLPTTQRGVRPLAGVAANRNVLAANRKTAAADRP